MKALLIALLSLGSISAFASSEKLCQNAYDSHYQRLELIRELCKTGELSEDQIKSRTEDSELILELSKSVMCKGISKSAQAQMKADAIRNASQN